MSRADAFDAYYRDSQSRMLHQVYAFAGTTDTARQVLADAYTAAGQHWWKLSQVADPDSAYKDEWIRERAFHAIERGQRSRRPWYVTARETSDENRPLLSALGTLEPQARALVVLVYLVRLDLAPAAREVGMTDDAALESLRQAGATLSSRGIDPSSATLTRALEDLRADLAGLPADHASQLRREGNRRRRSHMLLAGVTSLALAVGAGAITAAQDAEPVAQPERLVPEPSPTPTTETAEPEPEVTEANLSSLAHASTLDGSRPWRLVNSSEDFAVTEPVDECVSTLPISPDAEHLWVRAFASGGGAHPTGATQMLEVAQTPESARTAQGRLVKEFAGCAAGSHQLVGFRSIEGVGDRAHILTLRHVDENGVHDERVTVAQSGAAVVTWVARGTTAHPIKVPRLVRTLERSVNSVCRPARGSCTANRVTLVEAPPPRADSTRGFLTTVDLPLFAGLTHPWVATAPRAFKANPAATECDQADFASAGARTPLSRSFVVPGARNLPTYYGMTQTNGRFASPRDAARFTREVVSGVEGCGDRLKTLNVEIDEPVAFGAVTGRVWRIEVTTSPDQTLVFRVALLRYRDTVAQLTFTPVEAADTDHDGYVAMVVPRLAQRLTQR